MNKEALKANYKNACDDYLEAFCEKHGFDRGNSRWIADRPGEIADVGDYCVDMQTIADDINLDAPEEEFFKWYDYTIEMGMLGALRIPNFRSWIKGCPRKSREEIDKLKALKQKIEELKKELTNELDK